MGCASSSESPPKLEGDAQSKPSIKTESDSASASANQQRMQTPSRSPMSSNSQQHASNPTAMARQSSVQAAQPSILPSVHKDGSQKVLLQAGAVLMKLAEVRSERTAPIYFLRRALETILMDSNAIYASLQMITEAQDLAIMLVTAGESPSEIFLETNRAQWLTVGGDTGYAARKLCKRVDAAVKAVRSGTRTPYASSDQAYKSSLYEEPLVDPRLVMLGWSKEKERTLGSGPVSNNHSSQQTGGSSGVSPYASMTSQLSAQQQKEARKKVPIDWQQLIVCLPASLERLVMMPLVCNGRVLGALTLGLDCKGSTADADQPSFMDKEGMPLYLHLLCSSLASVLKDITTLRYCSILRAVHEVRDLDRLARHLIYHTRSILGFSSTNTSVWFRLALATGSGAAVIFDDPDQFNAAGPPPIPPLFQEGLREGSREGFDDDEGSRHGNKDKSRPPLARLVVNLKSSILKLCITNRQQVMIPDVPAFLSQTGRATSDLYINTDEKMSFQRPNSVLVFPLKVGGVMTGGSMALGLGLGGTEGPANGVKNGSYGAIFCMSGTLTDFSEVSPKLREICDVLSPHILQVLTSFGPLCNEYQSSVIQAPHEKALAIMHSPSKDSPLLFPSTVGGRRSQVILEPTGSKDKALYDTLLTANSSLRSIAGSDNQRGVCFLPASSGLTRGSSTTIDVANSLTKAAGSSIASQLPPSNSSIAPTLSVTGLAMERVESCDIELNEEDEEVELAADDDEDEEEEEGFDFFTPQDRMFESLLPPSDRAARMIEKMALKKTLKPEDLLSLASDLRGLTRRKGSTSGTVSASMGGLGPSLFGGSMKNSANFAQMIRGGGMGGFNQSHAATAAASALGSKIESFGSSFEKASVAFQYGGSVTSRGHGSKSTDPSSFMDLCGPQMNAMPTDVTKALINLLAVNDEEEEEEEEDWVDDKKTLSSYHSQISRQMTKSLRPSSTNNLPEHAMRLLKAPSDLVAQVLSKMDEWKFDTFELDRVTNGRPLSAIAFAVLKRCDLVPGRGPLRLHEDRLVRFLCKIEDGYPGPDVNPYHCKTHAADVVRSLYVILTKGGVLKALWPSPGTSERRGMDLTREGPGGLGGGGGGGGAKDGEGHGDKGTSSTPHLALASRSQSNDGRLRTSEIHDLPLLSAIIAAVIHDYEHKGFNNDFLIRSGHPLTMLYNDYSPMEQHHLSAAFGVLWSNSSASSGNLHNSMDFIASFSLKNRTTFRKQVIDMVLATDMKQHFHQLSQFLSKLPTLLVAASPASPESSATPHASNPINVIPAVNLRRGSMIEIDEDEASPSSASNSFSTSQEKSLRALDNPDRSLRGIRRRSTLSRMSASFTTKERRSSGDGGATGGGRGAMVLSNVDDEARTVALQMALKCADIGHWASDRPVHRKWVQSLEEEFFRQGDCEHEAGIPISPLMDRSKGGVTSSQGGFFSFVVQPQLQAMCSVFPGCTPVFDAAKDNLAMWAGEMGAPPSGVIKPWSDIALLE